MTDNWGVCTVMGVRALFERENQYSRPFCNVLRGESMLHFLPKWSSGLRSLVTFVQSATRANPAYATNAIKETIYTWEVGDFQVVHSRRKTSTQLSHLSKLPPGGVDRTMLRRPMEFMTGRITKARFMLGPHLANA